MARRRVGCFAVSREKNRGAVTVIPGRHGKPRFGGAFFILCAMRLSQRRRRAIAARRDKLERKRGFLHSHLDEPSDVAPGPEPSARRLLQNWLTRPRPDLP